MREFQIIEKYFKPLTRGHKAAQNLADDVAKISLKQDEELVISKDMINEDVHFFRKDGGFKIASKLLRSNLSDLAAAGAKPLYYAMGFSRDKDMEELFISEFARGLKSVQDEFDLILIGGDTVSSEKLFFSITIFGSIKKGKTLSRNQAKKGDLIFVSGNIGDAFLGLNMHFDGLNTKEKNYLLDRHFFPTPRIKLGRKLLEKNLSNCAIDVSDGLLADLHHICKASELDAEIHQNKIPISDAAKKVLKSKSGLTTLNLISGGDDYELIFSVDKKNLAKISELAKELKLDLTCIGEFKKSADEKFGIKLLDEKNQKINIKKFGYEH